MTLFQPHTTRRREAGRAGNSHAQHVAKSMILSLDGEGSGVEEFRVGGHGDLFPPVGNHEQLETIWGIHCSKARGGGLRSVAWSGRDTFFCFVSQ